MNATTLLVNVASAERENRRAFLKNRNYGVVLANNAESARRICLHPQPASVLLRDYLPRNGDADSCGAELVAGREAGAAVFTPYSLGDRPARTKSPSRLKSYVDEQAKSVILSLAHRVEARHSRTHGHSTRLAERALQLGESLGLSEDDLQELRLGCLLHDIGKVAVPDNILLKPARLSPEETEIVRQHPITGEKICAPIQCLGPILPLIRHHHERMDGSGYPDGLYGEEIPLKARILQVADVYDALTSDRPYREALSSEEALKILHQEAMHGWLDASLVWRFSRMCGGDYFPVRALHADGITVQRVDDRIASRLLGLARWLKQEHVAVDGVSLPIAFKGCSVDSIGSMVKSFALATTGGPSLGLDRCRTTRRHSA